MEHGLFKLDVVILESEDGVTLSRLTIRLYQVDESGNKVMIGFIKMRKDSEGLIEESTTVERKLLSSGELNEYRGIVDRARKLFEVETVCFNYECAYLVDGICTSSMYVESILEGVITLERKFLGNYDDINVVNGCDLVYNEFNKIG